MAVRTFQSAPPHGGRHAARPRDASRSPGFNPRPRTGGDLKNLAAVAEVVDVSIRAPARGATTPADHHGTIGEVSIRAPARGATLASPRTSARPPVSIRAPHGGRPVVSLVVVVSKVFNPRPRTGGDLRIVTV